MTTHSQDISRDGKTMHNMTANECSLASVFKEAYLRLTHSASKISGNAAHRRALAKIPTGN